jgi:hypothetical protein
MQDYPDLITRRHRRNDVIPHWLLKIKDWWRSQWGMKYPQVDLDLKIQEDKIFSRREQNIIRTWVDRENKTDLTASSSWVQVTQQLPFQATVYSIPFCCLVTASAPVRSVLDLHQRDVSKETKRIPRLFENSLDIDVIGCSDVNDETQPTKTE